MTDLTVLEICAGAGGQSLGLEKAGFRHEAAVEIDPDACETLRLNRPGWHVIETDVRAVRGTDYRGVDLIAGGVPCPPFSIGGKQLGADDERDLFPEALRLVREAGPAAVMLENVKGLQSARFESYRESILDELHRLGYEPDWRLLNASNFGVPQLRPRFILVAVKRSLSRQFAWPEEQKSPATVGETLKDLMAANGWRGTDAWVARAAGIAPTIVGGSRKHGGPDLGPTRARAAWLQLGVDGKGLANSAPLLADPVNLTPRLTLSMAARLQGFDDEWHFSGRKTAAYRQIGNAFPPPVAQAVGASIARALGKPRDSLETSDARSAPPTGKRGSGRGSIPASVVKAVVARDGGMCRYPKCSQGRLATPTSDGGWVFSGELAHIRAVSPGGPRYDATYTKAMLNHSTNVLVMCTQHHDEIDRHNPDRYSVERLESWLDDAREQIPERKVRWLRAG